MGKKKTPEPKNDFAVEEELDVCSFSEDPIILGKCIASFKFNDASADKCNGSAANLLTNNIATSEAAAPTQTIDFNNSTASNNNTNCTNNTDSTNNANDNFNNSTSSTPEVKTISKNKDILMDNRKAPIVNGCAPPIDGEYLEVKRTYMLRSSTVRKLNELKSINHDLNTYVSTIVDLALAHYYDQIVNEGGTQ